MKPYPAYKASGVEWLGEVPEGWEITALKHLCNVFTSNVDKHSHADEIPVRLCNYTDVYYNDQIDMSLAFMEATATQAEIDKFTLRVGDVVFTKDSETADDIGIAAIVTEELPGVICGYHLSIARPYAIVDGHFLKAYFDSKSAKAHFEVTANGLTRVGLGQGAIGGLPVPLPPLPEQRAIAGFLDREVGKIDALVAESRRLVALLAEKRQATISHAVTRGLNPAAPLRPSGIDWLGDIPEGWEVVPTGYRYEVQLGRMLNEERASGENMRPYLRVFDVQWGEINTEDLPLMDFPPDAQTRYRLQSGDLMVNEGGSYVGRSAIWRGEIEECYYQKALHRLRARDPAKDTAEFFYYVMDMATRRNVFVAGANQTTIDHLTAEQLRAHRFAFPPLAEQVAIAGHLRQVLSRLDALTAEANSAIALLLERRAALISAAVTGKIDVRGEAPAEAAAGGG